MPTRKEKPNIKSEEATGIVELGIIKNLIYDEEMKYFPTQKSDSTLALINTNKSKKRVRTKKK